MKTFEIEFKYNYNSEKDSTIYVEEINYLFYKFLMDGIYVLKNSPEEVYKDCWNYLKKVVEINNKRFKEESKFRKDSFLVTIYEIECASQMFNGFINPKMFLRKQKTIFDQSKL